MFLTCNVAEEQLKGLSVRPGFLILLLSLQNVKTVDASLRLGAALYFKNFVRTNWNQVLYVCTHPYPIPFYFISYAVTV